MTRIKWYGFIRKTGKHIPMSRCIIWLRHGVCIFFDSVVSYNDQIALEVIRALEDAGLKVPEDVSVTGYDDSYLASSGKVPLTTVAHPQEKLGEMAAELLLGLLKEGNIPESERQILVKPELVIRESCRSRKKEE